MSGHSKWSTIKRKKGAADQKRGKEFSKFSKRITLEVKAGGGDPDSNAKLRTVILKAKEINMTNELIKRAIQRGTGELDGQNYEEAVYEGYGPNGVAMIIEVITDNRNRTVADIRHLFSKHNGNLGEPGSVAWMFERKGLIFLGKQGCDEDSLMELGMDHGLEEIVDGGEVWQIESDPASLDALKSVLEGKGLKVESAEVAMVAKTPMDLEDKERESVEKLVEALEDMDDVENVYASLA